MRTRIERSILAIAGLLVVALAAGAEPPADISYQGQLLDADGNPLGGPVNLQIRIYESFAPSPGEVALFVEDHAGTEITTGGVFSITIGGGSAVSGTLGPETFEGTNRYLEVHVNGERLSPRQPFGSVPYAFHASRAENAGGALRVYDGLGNSLGLLVDIQPQGYLRVYAEEVGAIAVLDDNSGEPGYPDSVYFALPGCQGQAYGWFDPSTRLQKLYVAGEPRRYFAGQPGPWESTPYQSSIYDSTCTDESGSGNLVPAEEVTSSMPFSLPAPLPLTIGTEAP